MWDSVFWDNGSFAGSVDPGAILGHETYVGAGLWDRGIVRCEV